VGVDEKEIFEKAYMATVIPNLTFVMDASGRCSHEPGSPLVFAGVAIKTSAVDSTREALLVSTNGILSKWSQANTPEEAQAILRFIAKKQLYIYVRIIWKTGEAWSKHFDDGQQIYEKGVFKAQEPMPYAKPMNTFKSHMFGMTGSGLAGMYLGRHIASLPGKNMPVRTINITEILDSDVQGQTNQEICRNVLIGAGGGFAADSTEYENKAYF